MYGHSVPCPPLLDTALSSADFECYGLEVFLIDMDERSRTRTNLVGKDHWEPGKSRHCCTIS
jgi:hypothetical protein